MIVCDVFVLNIPKDNLSFPRISGQCSLAQRASESLPRNKTTGPFAPFTLVRLDISALCRIQQNFFYDEAVQSFFSTAGAHVVTTV